MPDPTRITRLRVKGYRRPEGMIVGLIMGTALKGFAGAVGAVLALKMMGVL